MKPLISHADTNSDMSTKYSGGHQQYFWEAFPTGESDALRTTYLFTYLDAREGRPSLLELFEDYWPRLKEYQVLATFRRLCVYKRKCAWM